MKKEKLYIDINTYYYLLCFYYLSYKLLLIFTIILYHLLLLSFIICFLHVLLYVFFNMLLYMFLYHKKGNESSTEPLEWGQ